MKRTGRNNWFSNLRTILFPAVLALVLVFFFGALSNLDEGRKLESKEQLETALRRAAVACYASEGIYPPTLQYLQTHYGVQIDSDRYLVFYELQGSNLMPEITVLEK